MPRSVKHHQGEAYETYEIAQQLSISKDEQADLAGIKDKDATIVAMSEMLVSTMEIVKVEKVTPAVAKRAHALREAGPDKSMKRILPRAVEDVNQSIARGRHRRSERERAGNSNTDERPPGYWEDCLELIDEKESSESSKAETNGSKDGASGDLIEL